MRPGTRVPASSYRSRARAHTHTLGAGTCGYPEDELDGVVHAIKDMFDATELSADEWAEYERTHDVETWDFRS